MNDVTTCVRLTQIGKALLQAKTRAAVAREAGNHLGSSQLVSLHLSEVQEPQPFPYYPTLSPMVSSAVGEEAA